MSAEDRVSAATEATAAAVRQIRPLELPETSAVPAQRPGHRGRRGPRVSGIFSRFRETWMIPLGSAAVVAALALTLVIVRHAEAPNPAPPQTGNPAPAVAGIPRYYAVATDGKASHDGTAAITVTVRDVYTGKTVAAVALPAVGDAGGENAAVGVSAAGDDRTFVAARRNIYGGIAYFLVHITPGAKQAAAVRQLPIPETALGVLLGFAVSPNGKELAALSVRGNGTTLQTYSVQTGATLRSWIAGTWRSTYSLYQQGLNVSWTADNRQVAFSAVVPTKQNPNGGSLDERVIGVTAPGGNLAAVSKVVLTAPANCLSLLLTPDGGTVVCGTVANYPRQTQTAGCGTNAPMLVAYSAATGKRLRILYQYPGTCHSAENIVLWSDDSARHVIGESVLTAAETPGQYTDQYGLATVGTFARLPVPHLVQNHSGPAF